MTTLGGTLLNGTASHSSNGGSFNALTNIPFKVFIPSDATGATDMTSEFETFVAANTGYEVVIPDNVTMLLNNAFQNVTTGDIIINFGMSTILYDHGSTSTFGLLFTNTANASSPVTVASIASALVHTDATVTQLTLNSTLNALRFNWIAFDTATSNPSKSGGLLGQIFQLLDDESSLVLTATRTLNRVSQFSTGNARILDETRRLRIRGGIFKANGNTEDHSITTRCPAIGIQGWVRPEIYDVTFDHPWAQCIQFKACAAPRWRNVTVRNVGNLADFNGFIYGVQLYAMNDSADGRQIVVHNGRHSGFTTDGNSSNTSTWYNRGFPTNFVIDGVHGFNTHASVVDTHEEGDGGHITNVSSYYSYQDIDISPDFTGIMCQLRCSNTRLSNAHCYGGTNGVKVTAVDHGFEDQVFLDNVNIYHLTQGASTDNDIGFNIADQSTLTNKRHVYLDNCAVTDAGRGVVVGKTAKITVGDFQFRNGKTGFDHQAGSLSVFMGTVTYDFRNNTRGASYNCNLVRSDSPNGGATVLYMRKPTIVKGGSSNTPTQVFTESDTTSNKIVWAPGLTEYNPSSTTATLLYQASNTSFTYPANLTDTRVRTARIVTAAGAVTVTSADDVVEVNKTVGAATTVNLPASPARGQTCTISDGKGDAAINNLTLTPAAGNINGAGTFVMNVNYQSTDIWYNGTQWRVS